MKSIFVILFLLMVVSMIGLILGVISPKVVIRWGTSKERKTVFKYYGSVAIVLFISLLVIAPLVPKDIKQIELSKNNTENLVVENEVQKNTTPEPKEKPIDKPIEENKDIPENKEIIQENKTNEDVVDPISKQQKTTGNDRFIIKSKPNTTDAINELYYKAKENAKEFTEDDIKEAIRYIDHNYNNYWTDNDKMTKTLYYGYLLQKIKIYKAKAAGNDHKNIDYVMYELGNDTVQSVKSVYRNYEKIEDSSTQINLKQIKKSLDLIPDEYKK